MLREEFGVGKLRGLQAAAGAMGQKIVTFNASRPQEIDAAFSTMVNSGAGALLVGPGPFLSSRRSQVITLAALNAILTSYFDRGSVDAGGLISYGASQTDVYRRAGIYVARILKGEKPGDLPVELPTEVRAGHQPQNCQGARPLLCLLRWSLVPTTSSNEVGDVRL